jgi:S1-C subfamily serine protease
MLGLFGALAVMVAACGGGDAETTVPTTTAVPPTTTTTSSPPTTTTTSSSGITTTTLRSGAVGPDTEAIATATVQVVQLDSQSGRLEFGCFSGSGSIISPEGLILTNAHVLELDQRCPYDTIGIAVLDRSDQPPDLLYIADLLAIDTSLDLAIARIAADLDGGPVDVEFPFLDLGDSQAINLGDQIRVLGYPGIGGDTITLTRGAVSGFTEERDIEGRAWIKTDATISGGNSGGSAVDAEGRLIGVPTLAASGANVDPTDCRVIQDTNGDGFLDDNDSCIPIGGFINGVRPINLALPLIAEAATASPIPVISTTPTTVATPSLDVSFGPITFSTGVTEDDRPVDEVAVVPSGTAERICAFWDYEGMADGLSVDALWYLNQEFVEDASYIDSEWYGGQSGNWWVCFINNDGPLEDGIYELILNVDGDPMSDEAIQVGDGISFQTFEVVNETPDLVCFVFLSLSEAQRWGSDELGETEIIDSGGSRVFEVPAGVYDIQAFDCDAGLLFEEFFMDVTDPFVFTYAG